MDREASGETRDLRPLLESHSGRFNHARMNERASPETFLRSFDPRSPGLHIPDDELYSSTASDLSEILSRVDLLETSPLKNTKEEPETTILASMASACLPLAAALNLEA